MSKKITLEIFYSVGMCAYLCSALERAVSLSPPIIPYSVVTMNRVPGAAQRRATPRRVPAGAAAELLSEAGEGRDTIYSLLSPNAFDSTFKSVCGL